MFIYLFWGVGTNGYSLVLLVVLCLEIMTGRAQGVIFGAKNQTWVSCDLSLPPIRYNTQICRETEDERGKATF